MTHAMCRNRAAAMLCLLSALLFSRDARSDDAIIDTMEVVGKLKGMWRLDAAEGEFPQMIRLFNNNNGSWQRTAQSLPFNLVWFVDGNELEFLNYDFATKGNTTHLRKMSRKFAYKLDGDTLRLTRDDKTMTFKRFEPRQVPSPGNGAIRGISNDVAGRFILFDQNEKQVVRTPWSSYNRGGIVEFFEDLKPGKYVLLGASPEMSAARQEIEVVADKETVVRIEFGQNASRIQIDRSQAERTTAGSARK
ncbi:MAG: hypothetical protein AB7O26_00095 [Planctomycetaceae bacterium]